MCAFVRDTPRDAPEYDRQHPKNRDPYIFKPAEWFFNDFAQQNTRPTSVICDDGDQKISGQPNPACFSGRIFRFNDNLGYLLVQFMRPRVWRIRFHHVNSSPSGFTDHNTRTIIKDTLTETIKDLDAAENVQWGVELHEVDSQYYVLQSVRTVGSERRVLVQLWIQKNPFKIWAVRSIGASGAAVNLPPFRTPEGVDALKLYQPPGYEIAVVWQTKDNPIQFAGDATVFSCEKSPSARYTGFGEQGGEAFFKTSTLMNYFNFDNMRYFNIYDQGPLENAEPLYHSEPYWIEMNTLSGHLSQVATFIDNYSHVCVDLGKADESLLRIATRFGSFEGIFIAGDNVGQIILSYTALLGRPNLKPRFVLGNHQGCYGYDNRDKVINAVQKYRQYNVPLDGMHVDVDIQRDYRTFTIDDKIFGDPKGMFGYLRSLGVKCSTNITPVVNARPDPNYSTLNEGLTNGYFVRDFRDIDPSNPSFDYQRYLQFGKGTRYFTNPNEWNDRPQYFEPDHYWFKETFGTGEYFHGGVDYGGGRGAPGHYPNLNNKEVRKWWGKQYQYLFDMGLEFVWQDMTSPCMSKCYGDMLSWPFRLLLDSDGRSGDSKTVSEKKKAIEIWSLYSYNLHKATFQGLQNMQSRNNKRNFIIGRGSFAGASRFAGLWTGDNVSSWDFLAISVAQVLALGLAGVTISGADVGGFEPQEGQDDFADPELLIRWYCAYSLLPWFRNHYTAKAGKKKFQEPYAYLEFQNGTPGGWDKVPEADKNMYYSVLPVCRYVIQFRYTLLQLMYDAMFENMITGLPIARAMIITDPLDTSLYLSNQGYTKSQYLVRNDILVAPALKKQRDVPRQDVYLPYPDHWYAMNLHADKSVLGTPLGPRVGGGTHVSYDCSIHPNESSLPYTTPMYIREGAIIPQIECRDYVVDRTRQPTDPANPITINVYPGKDRGYDMYLDDGVSRDSAPDNAYLAKVPNDPRGADVESAVNVRPDPQAKSAFRHVHIEQNTRRTFEADQLRDLRRVTIETKHDGYGDSNVIRDIGTEYRVVVWHHSRWPDAEIDLNTVKVSVSGTDKGRITQDVGMRATVVYVPVNGDVTSAIEVSVPAC